MSGQKVLLDEQGVELPTRARLLAELKKHGHIQDVQMISRQNAYTFKFDKERGATRAYDALDRKAHLIWKLPKVRSFCCSSQEVDLKMMFVRVRVANIPCHEVS